MWSINLIAHSASLSGYVTAFAGLLLRLTTSLMGLDCRTEVHAGLNGNASNALGSLFFMTGHSQALVSLNPEDRLAINLRAAWAKLNKCYTKIG